MRDGIPESLAEYDANIARLEAAVTALPDDVRCYLFNQGQAEGMRQASHLVRKGWDADKLEQESLNIG